MKIKPCGHYLIIKLKDVPDEQTSEGGIIVRTGDAKREQAGMSMAEVVDVGKNCWSGFVDHNNDWEAWCKKGDTIMIAQYGGQAFPVPDDASAEEKAELSRLKLIKDDDVLGVQYV